MKNKICISIAIIIMILPSCNIQSSSHIREIIGEWKSARDGRPSLTVYREGWGDYMAKFVHTDRNGNKSVGTFRIENRKGGLFIVSESTTMLIYDSERDIVRLLPGGKYERNLN